MRHPQRRWHCRPGTIILAALSPLAVLLSATVIGSDSAAASSAAAYTASYIPVASSAGSPVSVAVNPVTDTVYYLAENGSTITGALTVVNGSSRAIVATVPLAGLPEDIAIDSATNTVYVNEYVRSTGGQIEVIDGTSNSVSATISLQGEHSGIAVNSATNKIYAADLGTPGHILVIDGSTNKVTGTISSGGSAPYSVAVDEATDVIWVANEGGSVVAISGATGSIIHNVSMSAPLNVAVNPVTNTVYVVSNATTSPLTVIDGAAGAITTTVPVTPAWSFGVAVDPSTDVVFTEGSAPSGAGTVVIDGATNTVTDVLGSGVSNQGGQWQVVFGYGPAVDLATGVAYVATPSPQFPGLWAISSSTSNGISPLMTGTASAQTVAVGAPVYAAFGAGGLPAPTITVAGPLPAGVTLDPSTGVMSGVPAAGTEGVYPITITASNGVAPDYSLAFTLTVTAPPPSAAAAVGVEGTDGQLWVQAAQLGSGWHPLGGVITAPPAVAAAPNPNGTTPAQPLFIATGTDKHLYVRSLTAGWQRLDAATASCVGAPAAAITGTAPGYTVTVACRGTDNALWYNSTPWPGTGLPAFASTGWKSLGGVLSAGPAVAPVGTTVTFFVRGTTGQIFTRTAAAGYSPTSWACIG